MAVREAASVPMSAAPPNSPAESARRPVVLVADDSEDIRELFGSVLRKSFEVKFAANGEDALLQADTEPLPDLILLDVEMPAPDGYEVCAQLKANVALARIPVIFLTGKSDPGDQAKGLRLGAVDYITKPFSPALVLVRLRNHLALFDQYRALEDQIVERTRELHDTRQQIIRRLVRAMEYREGGLTNRVARVTQYMSALTQAMGIREGTAEIMCEAAPLYDIGKIAVPDYILRKTDQLNASEWEEMRRHAEVGAQIIGEHNDPLLSVARIMALTHHERWNGTGYPKGLAGNAIPLPGRIVAVIDAFEAMTATQRHRSPLKVAEAAKQIFDASGSQFDPAIVNAFRKALPKFDEIKKTYRDELEGIHNLDFAAGASKPGA